MFFNTVLVRGWFFLFVAIVSLEWILSLRVSSEVFWILLVFYIFFVGLFFLRFIYRYVRRF